jgi:hypothetical protein
VILCCVATSQQPVSAAMPSVQGLEMEIVQTSTIQHSICLAFATQSPACLRHSATASHSRGTQRFLRAGDPAALPSFWPGNRFTAASSPSFVLQHRPARAALSHSQQECMQRDEPHGSLPACAIGGEPHRQVFVHRAFCSTAQPLSWRWAPAHKFTSVASHVIVNVGSPVLVGHEN